MSTQSPKKCNWPECPNPPAGCFCGRCRKRMYRLGYGVTPADMPPAEVLADLERLWANRQPTVAELAAKPAPTAEPVEASDKTIRASLQYEIGTLRRQVEALRLENEAANEELRLTALAIYGEDHDAHELHKEADVLRREVLQLRGLDRDLADARAVLGPRFSGVTESLVGDIKALRAYVRTVVEEGGHYALLCQQAHDEIDRAGARPMGEGTPAERIRLLVADHDKAMGHRIAERDQSRLEKLELVSKVDHLQREVHFLQHPPVPPASYVQTQPKHHPWLDEVTEGSLVLTPRDVKIAKLSIDALADDTTDPLFVARVLRVTLSLDEVPRG